MSFTLLDDDLIQQIVSVSRDEQESWLILEPHERYLGHWEVNGLGEFFRFDLREIIGPHRIVSPANLEEFLTAAEEHQYEVAFGEDPERILDGYTRLSDLPPVKLDSHFEGTLNGLLPFQARGFNFLRDLPRGGVAQWSTGTGKSVLQAALLKYHLEQGNAGVVWSLAKSHNKINTQRTYFKLAGVESILLDGTPKRRQRLYADITERARTEPVVVVTNYEKFRDDFVWFERAKNDGWLARLHDHYAHLFHDQRLLILWDEMPTKLKTRTTKLYRAVQTCLYDAAYPNVDKQRPERLVQYMFSATPIENDPEDWFNCIRLIDPEIYGTVRDFQDAYVKRYSYFDSNKPEAWHNLDQMQLVCAHIVHSVDKERDPEIRSQFPEVIPEERVIDWSDKHRRVYDRLLKLADEIEEQIEEEGEGKSLNILGIIGVCQMLCDAPSLVGNAAALREAFEASLEAFEDSGGGPPARRGSEVAARLVEALGDVPGDEGHTKLEELRQDLTVNFADEKVIVFSALNNSLMPVLEEHLRSWGVTYVRYDGTRTQMQEAEDRFREDPDVQVFLSSDKGSDSINLEAASVTIHYDLPWKWSTKKQRGNRNHRVTSMHTHTREITYMMANSVEERKAAIIARKHQYHQAVFEGVIANQALSASMTAGDLRYILRG